MYQSLEYSDDELAAMLKRRDNNAISLIYDKYAAAILGSIYRDAGNVQIAEQILERAFIRIWYSTAHYNQKQNRLLIWMLNISKNETIQFFQKV